MKTINELLHLLKFNYENSDQKFGLCFSIFDLREQGIINSDEYIYLIKYLKTNIPVNIFYTWEGYECDDSELFWYPVGQSKPRLEWLNKHIEINKIL